MRRNPEFDYLKSRGIDLPDAMDYLPDEWRVNFDMAMDAQPTLITTSNAGIPAYLTTVVDPKLIRVVLAPNKMAEILGESQKGSWLDETAMFTMVERTGTVSSYGDYSNNGVAGVNTQFPQRQSYTYQTITNYGEREAERAGLARIGWAAEVKEAGVTVLNKFQNLTYAFGVSGLQNYGLLNDPTLSAALTPGAKAAGGTAWIVNGAPNATANEVLDDIQALYIKMVNQARGTIDRETPMVLAMPPTSETAMTFTNTFGVNVADLLKKNFPNIRVRTAVQYEAVSASNPQGVAGGNLVQLIAETVEGQDTGDCAFNVKLRSHPIIIGLSSFQQKMTQGTWGAVIFQPFAITQMLGV